MKCIRTARSWSCPASPSTAVLGSLDSPVSRGAIHHIEFLLLEVAVSSWPPKGLNQHTLSYSFIVLSNLIITWKLCVMKGILPVITLLPCSFLYLRKLTSRNPPGKCSCCQEKATGWHTAFLLVAGMAENEDDAEERKESWRQAGTWWSTWANASHWGQFSS